jgi:hypothetical protein
MYGTSPEESATWQIGKSAIEQICTSHHQAVFADLLICAFVVLLFAHLLI